MIVKPGSQRVLLANCFVSNHADFDLVLTEEQMVATAFGENAVLLEIVASDETNPVDLSLPRSELWDLSYSWFRVDGRDPTLIDGYSAGDLAGYEIGTALIGPFLRGVRLAENFRASPAWDQAMLEVSSFSIAIADQGSPSYQRYETILFEAFCLALGVEKPGFLVVHDERNIGLIRKYTSSRDVDFLPDTTKSLSWRTALVMRVFDACARLSRRSSLFVFEYNPTKAFARQVVMGRGRSCRIVRTAPSIREVFATLIRGHGIWLGSRSRDQGASALESNDYADYPLHLEIRGFDAVPVLGSHLTVMLSTYAAFIKATVPGIHRMLDRFHVYAILAPYEVPPVPRLVMHCARRRSIPTFCTTDGFPFFAQNTMGRNAPVAEHYLAWSEHTASWAEAQGNSVQTVVTGNPAMSTDRENQRAWPMRLSTPMRILYSPGGSSEIENRSASEAMFSEVLRGIEAYEKPVTIMLKPHPSDSADRFRRIATRPIEFRETGRIRDYFDDTDVLLTEPSTCLFEALLAGVPVMLLRPWRTNVSAGLPWNGDEWLDRRTAQTADDVTRLLLDEQTLLEPPPSGWLEHYIGSLDTGATDRILEYIQYVCPSLMGARSRQE